MATTPTGTTNPITWGVGGGTVWLLPLGAVSETELLARATLTAQEREVFDRFAPAQTQRRKEWLAGRVLVREQLGGRIGYESSGRPILLDDRNGGQEHRKHISISHTSGWAALMAADSPCGIDIELAGRHAERASGRIAMPEEISIAATLYPENPALLAWCAKEAAFKALGHAGTDFRQHIRIVGNAAAQTLLITVGTGRITLEFFILEDLIGVCGCI